MTSLVTPAEFAGYLQRNVDQYTADTVLNGASGLVRSYCRWGIAQETTTFTVDANGGRVVALPTLRLNDVTAVAVDGATLDAADFEWSSNGLLYRINGGCWPIGARRIVADVDHGYDPAPDEVRIVVCAVAARLYANPEGLASKTAADTGRVFTGLSELEMSLVAGYRIA